MSTIIKSFKDEKDVEQSDVFRKLIAMGDAGILKYSYAKVRRELCCHLMTDISNEYFLMLVRPWIRTLKFSMILDKASICNEKEITLIPALNHMNELKSDLLAWRNNGLTFQLFGFLTDSEIQLEKVLTQLEGIERAIEFCLQEMLFSRGAKYSKFKIQRYGVYALFNVGEAIGLQHGGKRSELFKFVKIITNFQPRKIFDRYKEYKKICIDDEIRNNPILRYIHSPNATVKAIQERVFPYTQKCAYRPTGFVPLVIYIL